MSRRSSSPRLALVFALLSTAAFPGVASASTDDSVTVPTVDTSTIVASRQGDAQTVDAVRRGEQVERGGSLTEFSLEPPPQSVCPGDSEHDSWRVQTFLVPGDVDPGTLTWASGPRSDTATVYPMYDTFTQPVIEGLLIRNEVAGQPARISTRPAMNFGVFVPKGTLSPGTYKVGLACSWYGATGNYWDTEIIITSSPDDEPAGLTWRLASAPDSAPAASGDGSGVPWNLIAIGVAVVAAIGWFLKQRARRTPSLSKESS
jgi:hypothetical protein